MGVLVSLKSSLKKSLEVLVWVDLSDVGRKMIIGIVYVNQKE